MVPELLEGENDGIKRGQTRKRLRERVEKGMFHTILQLLLQDTPQIRWLKF